MNKTIGKKYPAKVLKEANGLPLMIEHRANANGVRKLARASAKRLKSSLSKPIYYGVAISSCPSCEVPYDKHVGLIGTCAALQTAMKTLEQIARLPRGGMAKRLAGSTIAFIKSNQPQITHFEQMGPVAGGKA